jgi:predicted N-acetyltransferase YhbS
VLSTLRSTDNTSMGSSVHASPRDGRYTADAERTWRALTAPGTCTTVAVEDDRVVGLVQVQSDGVVQAHLSIIAVARDRRRGGIGRGLVGEAFERSGGQRLDLVSTEGADAFYEFFTHRRFPGFRLYLR